MKRLISILISVILLFGVLCVVPAAAESGEGYIFCLSDPEGDAALAEGAEALSYEYGMYRTDDFSLVSELEALGVLDSWEVDSVVTLDSIATDVEQLLSEDYRAAMLGYGYAKEKGITGKGITVAVIDSGLATSFKDNTDAEILEGVNYLVTKNSSERTNTNDTLGHGTFVTSVICGRGIGLAPKVSILPLKCFNEKTGQSSYIISAIYEAIAQYCDVINLSFGGTSQNSIMKTAIEAAKDAGIIVVAAGGNTDNGVSTGNDALRYPAAWQGVIGVGSVDNTKTVANTSVQNSSICVTAPGDGVKGFSRFGAEKTGSGTSYAAPIVSALAALARSVEPELTREQFTDLLTETAEDLGAAGKDNSYGYGLINPPLLLETLTQDSESIVVSGWKGGFGISAWSPESVEASMTAFYTQKGILQNVVYSEPKCFLRLPDNCFSLSIFSLDGNFSPVSAARRLIVG